MDVLPAKPRLLDLFCGAGGAARGYQEAGFHVTGVDNRPQPRYAGEVFIQDDALAYCAAHGHEYDAIHASPPCQHYTEGNRRYPDVQQAHPDLIAPVRAALLSSGRLYVIENVQGAKPHLRVSIRLCGTHFGQPRLSRHRLFECSVFLFGAGRCFCRRNGAQKVGVYGERPDGRKLNSRYGTARAARSLDEAREVMGIDWMDWNEIKEAIPPAYTKFIGQQLRSYV